MNSKGDDGEQQAVIFLRNQGIKILARNYRSVCGEIDIIARDGETLCFIEVRCRAHSGFGTPQETIDKTKQKKIIKTAQRYLQTRHKGELPECRFDVMALLSGKPTEWIKNAFE